MSESPPVITPGASFMNLMVWMGWSVLTGLPRALVWMSDKFIFHNFPDCLRQVLPHCN